MRVSLGAEVDGLSTDVGTGINVPLDTRNNDVAVSAARSGGGGTANSAQQYHKHMP